MSICPKILHEVLVLKFDIVRNISLLQDIQNNITWHIVSKNLIGLGIVTKIMIRLKVGQTKNLQFIQFLSEFRVKTLLSLIWMCFRAFQILEKVLSVLKYINRYILLKHKNDISNIIRYSFEKVWSSEVFFITKVIFNSKISQLTTNKHSIEINYHIESGGWLMLCIIYTLNNIDNKLRHFSERLWSSRRVFHFWKEQKQHKRGPEIKQQRNLTRNFTGCFTIEKLGQLFKGMRVLAVLGEAWVCFRLCLLFTQDLVGHILQSYCISQKFYHTWLRAQAKVLLSMIQECSLLNIFVKKNIESYSVEGIWSSEKISKFYTMAALGGCETVRTSGRGHGVGLSEHSYGQLNTHNYYIKNNFHIDLGGWFFLCLINIFNDIDIELRQFFVRLWSIKGVFQSLKEQKQHERGPEIKQQCKLTMIFIGCFNFENIGQLISTNNIVYIFHIERLLLTFIRLFSICFLEMCLYLSLLNYEDR